MPGEKFTTREDQHLIHFLAEPCRIDKNYASAELYNILGGKKSPYQWSQSRKSEAYVRRARTIDGLVGKVMKAAKVLKEMKLETPPKSKKPRKGKRKTVLVVEQEVKTKETRRTTYNVDDELDAIAADNNCSSDLVRAVFAQEKTVLATNELIVMFGKEKSRLASLPPTPYEKGDSSEEEDDDDDESIVAKQSTKETVKVKRERVEDSSSEDERPTKKKAKVTAPSQ
ncbi:hypothetical protein C8F04DRAFT_487852 [Mycena alexandri]|uniref:Uncharacterized protein n=1 Tax=Mycena alexandri TaxID=1745969 RepID=A0AAD6SXX5_9AGAR|nr:hypothetical protein C8F04DRAFT_487852 [Mycena alexandri]